MIGIYLHGGEVSFSTERPLSKIGNDPKQIFWGSWEDWGPFPHENRSVGGVSAPPSIQRSRFGLMVLRAVLVTSSQIGTYEEVKSGLLHAGYSDGFGVHMTSAISSASDTKM